MDLFDFIFALAIFSLPFLIALWLVRKTVFVRQVVLFLFLLILPFGFAAWVVCSAYYNMIYNFCFAKDRKESGSCLS